MSLQTKLPKVGTTIFTVMSQLAAEHGAVNLGQGFPDFAVPQRLIDELDRAMRDGHNQYAPMTGVAPLRQAIAEKVLRCYGREVNPDTEITVTSGATEALFNAIHAVVRPGEEVIVLDPAYDSYEPAIDLAGARAVHVPLDPQTFAVDWDRVQAAITPKTRLLIINSPHNPSGAMFDETDLQRVAEILRGTGIYLISDEVYEHIVFDGRRHESVLRYPELAERAFVGVTEQVAFVVMRQRTVGRGPQQAIEHAIGGAQLDAAGHRGIQLAGLFADPRDGRAVHVLGAIDGLVAEAAGEGLRQDDQIGHAGQRRDQLRVVVAVAGRIVPAGFALHERKTQVVHRDFLAHHSRFSRSIAASSVAAFLAKHRRASRCCGGAAS